MNVKKAKALRKKLGYKPRPECGETKKTLFQKFFGNRHSAFLDRKYVALQLVSYGSSTVTEVPRTLVNDPDSPRGIYREAKNQLNSRAPICVGRDEPHPFKVEQNESAS